MQQNKCSSITIAAESQTESECIFQNSTKILMYLKCVLLNTCTNVMYITTSKS